MYMDVYGVSGLDHLGSTLEAKGEIRSAVPEATYSGKHLNCGQFGQSLGALLEKLLA